MRKKNPTHCSCPPVMGTAVSTRQKSVSEVMVVLGRTEDHCECPETALPSRLFGVDIRCGHRHSLEADPVLITLASLWIHEIARSDTATGRPQYTPSKRHT
jgi:hypothetical protein